MQNSTAKLALALFSFGLGLTSCQSQGYTSDLQLRGSDRQEDIAVTVRRAVVAQAECAQEFSQAAELLAAMDAPQEDRAELFGELQGQVDTCASAVDQTAQRIATLEQEGELLFSGWESELDQFANPRMRARSDKRMQTVREGFDALSQHLHQAQAQMETVLTAHRDYLLFFNHNLGVNSLSTLEEENQEFWSEMRRLHHEVEGAAEEARSFLDEIEGQPQVEEQVLMEGQPTP